MPEVTQAPKLEITAIFIHICIQTPVPIDSSTKNVHILYSVCFHSHQHQAMSYHVSGEIIWKFSCRGVQLFFLPSNPLVFFLLLISTCLFHRSDHSNKDSQLYTTWRCSGPEASILPTSSLTPGQIPSLYHPFFSPQHLWHSHLWARV